MTDRQDPIVLKIYAFFGLIICIIISALTGIDSEWLVLVVCGSVVTLIVVSFIVSIHFWPHSLDTKDVDVISLHMARQGWSVHQIEEGKNRGKVYYYNSVTGERTWQIPESINANISQESEEYRKWKEEK